MIIQEKTYGFLKNGKEVKHYNLKNNNDVSIDVINYGCIITKIIVPDKNGDFDDVVLGFDKIEDYEERNQFFGSVVGRYANRIESGILDINGETYYLAKNDNNNHLHGGNVGYDKVLWESQIVEYEEGEALELRYLSKDKEENYPGNLDVKVLYYLSNDNELIIQYYAKSDKDTVCNLSNHSYFNLKGHNSADISNHMIRINANKITTVDSECLADGNYLDVDKSPFDFINFRGVGENIDSDHEQIKNAGGYDHNWVLKDSHDEIKIAAELYDPDSGRFMEVYTTKPGIQFYSGNFLKQFKNCKDGASYNKRSGLCLETQYFPNSIKHKHFPSPILKKNEIYEHKTIYKFSVRD